MRARMVAGLSRRRVACRWGPHAARSYGLLELSDKAGGADFTEEDADNIRELAAFAGATPDALQAACERSAGPAG